MLLHLATSQRKVKVLFVAITSSRGERIWTCFWITSALICKWKLWNSTFYSLALSRYLYVVAYLCWPGNGRIWTTVVIRTCRRHRMTPKDRFWRESDPWLETRTWSLYHLNYTLLVAFYEDDRSFSFYDHLNILCAGCYTYWLEKFSSTNYLDCCVRRCVELFRFLCLKGPRSI